MSQKDYIVSGIKLKQKSTFNLDELYKLMYRWFELYGYAMQEIEYRDSDEPAGKHLEIRWYAEKKENDYIKFVIKISFIILGMTKVEIEREGLKEATNNGEVEMRFDAYLEKDYDDKWTAPLARFLREVYDRLLIKKRIEGFEDMLNAELYKLIDEIKAFLDMHRFS